MKASGISALERRVRLKKATAQYVRGDITLEAFKEAERRDAPQYAEGLRVLGAAIKRSEQRRAEKPQK